MSDDNNRLTADMINKAQVLLKKKNAPEYDGGGFMALIHPSLSYDIRQSKGWLEPHQYAAPNEIFEGEIGKIHGVRFVESSEAKITKRTLSGGEGLVYSTFIMGKDAYAVIDPESGGLRMIVKGKGEIGGPLEQFYTAGYKFGIAAKILYPDRIVRLESCSELAYQDNEN